MNINGFVEEIKGFNTRIIDTRKTIPWLRSLEKYAVRAGGGHNHRRNLGDGILIKDNHIAIHNSLSKLIEKAKSKHKKIEVEVEDEKGALLAAKSGVNIILLDNFTPKRINQVIKKLEKNDLRKKVKLEASGGINLKNIQSYAKTGIDMISVGSITNSPKSIDMSLEIC